jgi:hypothetical protein
MTLKQKFQNEIETESTASLNMGDVLSWGVLIFGEGQDRPMANLWAVHPPERAICPLDSENRLHLYSALEGILYFSHKDLYVSANA